MFPLMSSHQISNLELLKTAYKNVHDVYLDSNQVDHIETLEGAFWLQSFRVFSLGGNRLTKVGPSWIYLFNYLFIVWSISSYLFTCLTTHWRAIIKWPNCIWATIHGDVNAYLLCDSRNCCANTIWLSLIRLMWHVNIRKATIIFAIQYWHWLAVMYAYCHRITIFNHWTCWMRFWAH